MFYKKINNYLMVNPIERINDPRLSSVFDYCNRKQVSFNDRVETVTTGGSVDSESLIDD